MSESLPTLLDISPTGALYIGDEKTAVDHFLGKNLTEAEALFREHDLYYLEDLMWMGPKAFVFYYKAFRRYFRQEKAARNASTLGFFLTAIGFQVEHHLGAIGGIADELRQDLQFCLYHHAEFEVDEIALDRINRILESLRKADK